MSDDIVERLRSQSILDGWLPMMEEAAVEIDRQRKVISAMTEDCQYLKDKQIEAADEIEKLREALKPFADCEVWEGYKGYERFVAGMFHIHNKGMDSLNISHIRAARAAYLGEKE